ncbi:MAG TPA: AAA family ATPase, partial [Flavobacteriaceae bacterium]|nr:AAA family ATPase [Flavobacteriaceae bacterium]
MNAAELSVLLETTFPHDLTVKQRLALEKLAGFITEKDSEMVFLLKGFAGTGKTTIISTLVLALEKIKLKTVLLAPTGRAAKVVSGYAQKEAFTIHKKIYYPKSEKGGGVSFTLQQNKHRNTIFIIDEASMIADTASESKLFENGSLLDDVMQYIYNGFGC